MDKPHELAERLGLILPKKPLQKMKELGLYDEETQGAIIPGLRDLVMDVCLKQIRNAAVVGPRGGGKSQGVSFIEFYMVFVAQYDALNLGGSELQADQVYQYLLQYLESDPYWRTLLKGEPQQSRTETVDNAWIRVLTASQKSVRSPHAGGRKPGGRMAGGILVIDEEAEAAADIVEAALPTVNTARPSVVLRSSTFHNAEGSFKELIDNHEEMGFKLYKWDIFDVAEPCECVGSCQSPEPCFREDHKEKYLDPEDGLEKERLVHPAYCAGKTRYAEGWIPMSEIEALWKRIRRNHERWEVEAMGSRPSTAGHVIKDLTAYSANISPLSGPSLYIPGCAITICVDWGSVAAGLTVWQAQPDDRHVILHAEELHQSGQTATFGKILGYAHRYAKELEEVAADIGGGGNYLNPKMREENRLPVRDVNFAEEKEAAVAAWNIFNEAHKTIYPQELTEFHAQVRSWRRRNGRIAKGNDHLCDSAVCYFAKFIDQLGLTKVRITPRTFSSNSDLAETPRMEIGGRRVAVRRPMVRSLGGRRRSS